MVCIQRIFLTASLLVLAGCAGSPSATRADVASRDCFSASSVRGFTPIDETTIQVQAARNAIYELQLMSYCPDIDWTLTIGLRTASGSSWICTTDALGVEVAVLDRRSAIGPDSCRVRSIRRLDAAEVAAQRAAVEQRRAERKAARAAPVDAGS